MAFGDEGEFTVRVGNVPFKVDAASLDEARQKVGNTLAAAPELFDTRLQTIGMSREQVDSLLTLQQGQRQSDTGRERFLQDLSPEDAGQGAFDRFALGAGRTFAERGRGVRQILAGVIGDTETAELLAEIDREEEEIFDRLKEKGIFTMTNMGSITPDLLAFLIPSAAGAQLTRMGVASAGAGTGIVPTMLMGAALGATQVQQADDFFGRGGKAAAGAAGSIILPAAASALSTVGRLASHLPGSFRATNRVWLRWHGMRNNPQHTRQVLDDALAVTDDGMSEGQQIIGRAALDKVQEVVRSLPATEARGLQDEVALATIRSSVGASTRTLSNGRNVLNAAEWEAQTASLLGRVAGMFKKSEHTRMAASLQALAREMQKIPDDIPVELAEETARALLIAPASVNNFIKAMAAATNPTVKRSLLQSIADIARVPGELAATEVSRGAGAAIGANLVEPAAEARARRSSQDEN